MRLSPCVAAILLATAACVVVAADMPLRLDPGLVESPGAGITHRLVFPPLPAAIEDAQLSPIGSLRSN